MNYFFISLHSNVANFRPIIILSIKEIKEFIIFHYNAFCNDLGILYGNLRKLNEKFILINEIDYC